ncbi:MAG TPA: ABC transporter substrate-binding protein [Pseudonocardiaceae bacterium]|jgi:sulfonate transport system substrate-binding protein|nr:ABC transporter substrate-binding protein [Pseudonocardiaceae bacterium]
MNRSLVAVPVLSLLAFGVLALAAGCVSSNGATNPGDNSFGNGPVTLRIGDQQESLEMPLQLSGQLANLPYKVQFDQFNSGPLVDQAFSAGAIDAGFMGDTPAMFAQASGVPVQVITVSRTDGPYDVLIARAGSGIHSLADLRGKKIATTKDTAPHGFLLRALNKAGLAQNDITLVDIPLLQLGNILQSGTVDAATVSVQQAVNYQNLHPDAVRLASAQQLAPTYGFELATRSALTDPAKLSALQDFAQRLVRSNAWKRAHVDQWINAYYVQYQKQTPANAKIIYAGSGASTYIPVDATVQTNQQHQADLFLKNGLITKPVDFSSQFDQTVIGEFNRAIQAVTGQQ